MQRGASTGSAYVLERALLPGGVADEVPVTIADGRFAAVGGEAAADATRVPGLTIPGLANCHSHVFHRALRGRTQRGRGTFWTWREQMYAVAGRLDPDLLHALAAATYREMVASGITAVGEFHYLHHQPDGTPYAEPNAMRAALVEAARDAGIRLTLLDSCYLSSGFGAPVEGVQRRYCDGDAERWAERAGSCDHDLGDTVRLGAAIHSVRAVPREQVGTVVAWAEQRRAPLHVHLSEQRGENARCSEAYGRTPTQVLADAGALGERTTAVHATHLTDADVALLGRHGAYVGLCPTTERDLGDGIGPARALAAAGARLTLGSDSHAVVDLFEEMRATELDERLATEQRGHWSAAELLAAATRTGHESLGWHDAGAIEVGRRADLVTLDTEAPTTAGTGADEQTAVFAATAADVVRVIADGRLAYARDQRAEVGRGLADAIGRVWS